MAEQAKEEGEIFPSFEPEQLHELLKEHASAYNTTTDEEVKVDFTDKTPHLERLENEKPTVMLNPALKWQVKEMMGISELDAVRLLLDTLSHEVEHHKRSPEGAMKEFVEDFPDYSKVAFACLNIVEDRYIDYKRLQEFEGLKRAYDIVTEMGIMKHTERMNDSDRVGQMISVLQITTRGDIGWPDEYELTDIFLKKFQEEVEPLLQKIQDADNFEEREEIARQLAATVIRYAPDDFKEDDELPDELEELLDELLDELVKDLAEEFEMELDELPSEMKERMKKEQDELIDEESIDIDVDIEPDAEPEDESEDESEGSDGEVSASGSSSSGSSSSSSSEGSAGGGSSADRDTTNPGEGGAGGSSGDGEVEGSGSLDDPDKDISDEGKVVERKEQKLGSAPGGAGSGRAHAIGGGGHQGEIPDWVREGIDFDFSKDEEQKVAELSDDVEEILQQLKPEESTREVNATKGSKLDVRKAVRHKAGDTTENKVFKRKKQEDTEDRTIGLTLDCSGSMDGRPIKEGRAAIAALGRATDNVGDNYAVNNFYTDGDYSDETGNEIPKTKQITGVDEDFDEDQLERVKVHSLDPMALGITEIEEEIEDQEGEKVIFAVGDGDPTINSDGSERHNSRVEEEVEEEVERIRKREDFEVIGIAVGESPNEKNFDKMFGEDGWFRFDTDELAEKLLTVYRNKVRS